MATRKLQSYDIAVNGGGRETKAAALALLARLETEGTAALPEHVRDLIDRARGWGDTPAQPFRGRRA